MGFYYFDTETTHYNPTIAELITLQIQPLCNDGFPKGELEIYKVWEMPKDDIIDMVYHKLIISLKSNRFEFIPVGFNLRYDFLVLAKDFEKKYPDFNWKELFDRPWLDFQQFAIVENKGMFAGANGEFFAGKQNSQGRNDQVPIWYENKEYLKIENYIRQETKDKIEAYQKRCKLLVDFRESLNKNE